VPKPARVSLHGGLVFNSRVNLESIYIMKTLSQLAPVGSFWTRLIAAQA
jgi:hypothetical protein